MCKKLLEKGKCEGIKDKSCKFAHNPIELSLIPYKTKKENLEKVQKALDKKLKINKVAESWVPAGKQSLIKDLSYPYEFDLNYDSVPTVYAKYREKTEFKGEDDKEDEKPKSIFERENIFRKPFEEKD